MPKYSSDYLKLLAETYPNEAAVCSEIINFNSILELPKGTEHFISDLHGEYEAVRHILNNCSGVILEKVRKAFEKDLGEAACRELCTIIYYPAEELSHFRENGRVTDEFLGETIERLQKLAEGLSVKYTRAYVRKQMTEGHEFILEELLHMHGDEEKSQTHYHKSMIDSVVSTGFAETIIIALASLIKNLAVERLHVVGDIFDRGSKPADIVEMLMKHPSVDIQWGNHDILWLGAAAGSPACVFTVLRISLDYSNMAVLERSYGIPLRPLSEFCEKIYGGTSPSRFKQALNILGAKLEGQVIKRHKGFNLDHRLMLEQIDYNNYTIEIEGKTHDLKTKFFPTVNPSSPYDLSHEEELLVEEYVQAFCESTQLRRHMNFIYKKGSTYLCYNGNLIYHGCIPMEADGNFAKVRHDGIYYSGRSLLDHADTVVNRAWVHKDGSALDMMWYLWCGENSPFSGREFHTFERAFVEDESTWEEPKNAYFGFWENEDIICKILREFSLDDSTGHIINGHTPVKAKKGESPVKANGKLFIIDGGFCKAYQKTTGLAGYTLIYSSHGIRLKSHRPFEGVASVIKYNADMESDSVLIETFPRRLHIKDTDVGEKLKNKIVALNELLDMYRTGEISQNY